MFDQFRNAVANFEPTSIKQGEWPNDLLIDQHGAFSTYYAPFDYINTDARVVLLGITPGEQQAKNALHAAQLALRRGDSDAEVLQQAKVYASFSGSMRRNLVSMLDHVGLDSALGVKSCASLWGEHANLVHFTSALRYPVFKDGKNYSGNPSISKTSYLKEQVVRWTGSELKPLSSAWIVPLGTAATEACDLLARERRIDGNRVLKGIPHPSGANIERIKYFLGQKEKRDLSIKVNAVAIEKAREAIKSQIRMHHKKAQPVDSYRYYSTITRGKNTGIKLYPHRFEDGNYVTSPSRFEGDYVRSPSLDNIIEIAKARGWKIAMSNPDEGIPNRSMVNYDSLVFE